MREFITIWQNENVSKFVFVFMLYELEIIKLHSLEFHLFSILLMLDYIYLITIEIPAIETYKHLQVLVTVLYYQTVTCRHAFYQLFYNIPWLLKNFSASFFVNK